MVIDHEYRVRLDAFEGPLDLLLFLIRRAEVDIHDIPVAAIADQYLEYLGELDRGHARIDIELAGEFLVMAATLMEIKSQLLMPRPAEDSEQVSSGGSSDEAVDPRADLVKQLLAYKRYRDLADGLERRREEWSRRSPVSAVGIDSDALQAAVDAASGEMHLEDVNLSDLAEAYRRVSSMLIFERLGDHQVTYDDTPIELHAADIVDRLKREAGPSGAVRFADLFAGRQHGEMIGLFLAMLELVRKQEVRLGIRHQESGEAEIEVSLSGDSLSTAEHAAQPETRAEEHLAD
ncbi:MAG: segregation/condensation protein A [Phycisphaeraceae bacterium]|nr:segregation/condensation protein A [Phycisphaeraceae bacterium]